MTKPENLSNADDKMFELIAQYTTSLFLGAVDRLYEKYEGREISKEIIMDIMQEGVCIPSKVKAMKYEEL